MSLSGQVGEEGVKSIKSTTNGNVRDPSAGKEQGNVSKNVREGQTESRRPVGLVGKAAMMK